MKTSDGVVRVSIEPAERTAVNLISPNWCDKRTWAYTSVKTLGAALVNSGNNLLYTGAGPWVDNKHGLYSDEDTITNSAGEIPFFKVYVNGVQKVEQDAHTLVGGDFTVDYTAGTVLFLAPLLPTDVVTADFFSVNSSSWTIAPIPGYKLKIKSVEAQFSSDVSIRDTLLFQTFGYVDVFAPQLVNNPYPSGTKIPISTKVYKTMLDYINEANGAMPVIYATTAPSPTWRDLTVPVQTYPWNYQSMKTLYSSYGMETKVYLMNDQVFSGTVATATFYCYSEEE